MINKKVRVIGLMSGTSMDGVNASIIEIKGNGDDKKVKLLHHNIYPINKDIRRLLQDISAPGHGTTELVCHINFVLGKIFAKAALRIIKEAGVKTKSISLIGSHGQTICHIPQEISGTKGKLFKFGYRCPSTLQVGEPSVIAELTGITTVGDFRPRDIAAGGEGAPLTPYTHKVLFGKTKKNIAINNLGGISNVTYLSRDSSSDNVIAFDTGPGNMVIDSIINLITDGKKRYDLNGSMAKKGEPDKELLNRLLSNAFLKKSPPKSTGREDFGFEYSQSILNHSKMKSLSPVDILATVTSFTAKTIALSYKNFILNKNRIDEAIFCGGGINNKTLMKMIKKELDPIPVKISDNFGIPAEAVESSSFAILAHAAICGEKTNFISATGAKRKVVLGKIVPGDNGLLL